MAEAFTELRRLTGQPTPERAEAPPPAPQTWGSPATPGSSDDPEGAEHLERFLAERMWRSDIAARFGLTAVIDRSGRPRIRFPFRSAGETLTHQDRAAAGQAPKYLAAKGQHLTLYARDLAHALDGTSVIVLEGPPDVVALAHTFPGDGVLALPGTEWANRPHVARTLTGLDVVLAMDNDAAGQAGRATLTAALLTRGARVANLHYPADCNDLDDWRRALGGDDQRLSDEFLERVDSIEWERGRHRAAA